MLINFRARSVGRSRLLRRKFLPEICWEATSKLLRSRRRVHLRQRGRISFENPTCAARLLKELGFHVLIISCNTYYLTLVSTPFRWLFSTQTYCFAKSFRSCNNRRYVVIRERDVASILIVRGTTCKQFALFASGLANFYFTLLLLSLLRLDARALKAILEELLDYCQISPALDLYSRARRERIILTANTQDNLKTMKDDAMLLSPSSSSRSRFTWNHSRLFRVYRPVTVTAAV